MIFGEHQKTGVTGRTFGRTFSGDLGPISPFHALSLPKAQIAVLDGEIPRLHGPRGNAFDEADGAP